MNMGLRFSIGLLAVAFCCSTALGQVTVVDFGAIQDNCCGDQLHVPFTIDVEAGDPTPTVLLQNNAATAQGSGIEPLSIGLNGGATLTWNNASAWNNDSSGTNPGQTYLLRRATDPLTTTFNIATANPNDLVTIDFIGGFDRDALITLNGVDTIIPATNQAGTIVIDWTNAGTDLVGSQTGELNVNSADEGNIGAARITITPAVVPEPTSLVLLGLGACTAVLRRRRS